jgi:uncharacterized protein
MTPLWSKVCHVRGRPQDLLTSYRGSDWIRGVRVNWYYQALLLRSLVGVGRANHVRCACEFFAIQRSHDPPSAIVTMATLCRSVRLVTLPIRNNRRLAVVSRRCASSSDRSSPLNRWTAYPKSFCIGSLAGLGGSLAGMGGGFVMIPLMTMPQLLRLSQHQAHGTSLFAVMATGLAGAISYGDAVQYDAAAAVAACGMVSARLGAKATGYMSEQVLRKMLGILMLVMAPVIPAKSYLMDHYESLKQVTSEESETTTTRANVRSPEENTADPWRLLVPAMIGMVSGFLAGVFGVGGGVIVVPALTIALDVNHYQALATSLAAMTPPAAVGVYTHYTAGNVAMRVAPFLALGAFTGAYIGGRVGLATDETTLRWGFSGVLGALGVRTILKS